MEKKAYNTKEIQELTGLGRDAVLKLLKTGKLVRVGRRWLISVQALDSFLNGYE
ncbi:hypothetical protein SPSIL_009840 [Sporomusa silvacetica DSM 10669]|uniref:Helix-turn-helix domain-containing protein n=1 Tax=Sporomusa silvacetica DSM 10669 TaxID=1123289 RepID=A0ABZ3IGY1_9FIRM|nr:helix-turn-helix domain-containing protein [Sporomusa silvacetica]OZC23149.1 helix-turn-helix domain protein [Sporomusa silvacetica DSM 10669]